MNNLIFLISTGRTGTKYFSNFFTEYGTNVVSYHTTRYTRLINILANMYRRGYIPISLMSMIWKRLKFKYIASQQKRYIECNPYYYSLIDIISEYFPKAKFIIIVRHPKSFIESHIQWERQRWKSMFANRILPFWQPVSYWQHLLGFTNNYHQRVEFYSKIWAIKNDILRQAIEHKKNLITIRFEDIFNPKYTTQMLSDLMKWLEIPLVKPINQSIIITKVNVALYKKKDGNWDERCTEAMLQNCSDLMRFFGYEFSEQ